jgi:hypothetical protein
VGDYVHMDVDWLGRRHYRLVKSLNDVVMEDARRDGILRVAFVAPQGMSVKMRRIPESMHTWHRDWPIHVQLSHHSAVYPITFIARIVDR